MTLPPAPVVIEYPWPIFFRFAAFDSSPVAFSVTVTVPVTFAITTSLMV